MKFKLDENTPNLLKKILNEKDVHDVVNVRDETLGGSTDHVLAMVCKKEERILITLDMDFSKPQLHKISSLYGVIIINPSSLDRWDIKDVFEHFLEKFRTKFHKQIKSVAPAAYRLLSKYDWPGNIRELENVIEHAFVVCHGEIIETEHLPERLWPSMENVKKQIIGMKNTHPLKNAERILIESTLEKYGGHRAKTAKALGIDKATLWRKMKKFGLL